MRVQNTFDIAEFDSGLSDALSATISLSKKIKHTINPLKKEVLGVAFTAYPAYYQTRRAKEVLPTT
jgi:hypothetical protein